MFSLKHVPNKSSFLSKSNMLLAELNKAAENGWDLTDFRAFQKKLSLKNQENMRQ